MTAQHLEIAVVGAGGKMGMRVSDNLQRSTHHVRYVENSPAGQQRTLEAGRTLTEADDAVRDARHGLTGRERVDEPVDVGEHVGQGASNPVRRRRRSAKPCPRARRARP